MGPRLLTCLHYGQTLLRFFLLPLIAPAPFTYSQAVSVVALCKSPIPEARHSILLPQGDGPPYSLVTDADEIPTEAECRTVSTGFPVGSITWLGAIASSELDSNARIALTERAEDQKIIAIEIERRPQVIAPRISGSSSTCKILRVRMALRFIFID
jgi:hypothetical protein